MTKYFGTRDDRNITIYQNHSDWNAWTNSAGPEQSERRHLIQSDQSAFFVIHPVYHSVHRDFFPFYWDNRNQLTWKRQIKKLADIFKYFFFFFFWSR